MYDDHNSSNPSPVPDSSSGLLAIEPADVQPVPKAASTPVFETDVKISDLIIDPDLQMRVKDHEPEYIAALKKVTPAGKLPPIEVFRDSEDGPVWVADGHARVAAAKAAKCATIRARVHPGGRDAAFEFALGANRTHGVRRTPEDLRNAVRKALTDPATAKCSSRMIAQKCDCSDRYVRNVRDALVPTDGAQEARVKGKDGKTYSAKPHRRTAGADSPHLNGSTSVSGPSPSESKTLASTVAAEVSAVDILGGPDARVTTPTQNGLVITPAVSVRRGAPTAAVPGETSHAATPSGDEKHPVVQAQCKAVPDAAVVSTQGLGASPINTTPAVSAEDPVEALREALERFEDAALWVGNVLLDFPIHGTLDGEFLQRVVGKVRFFLEEVERYFPEETASPE